MSLLDSASALFFLGVVFAGLVGLFIVLSGLLRLAEHISPRFSRWLDRHIEPGIWDES